MWNTVNRRTTARIIAIASALLSVSASVACYVKIERSCGALHANTTRVCTVGANAVPCGDVILDPAVMIADIRGANVGEAGRVGIDDTTPAVSVRIHYFKCRQANNQGRCDDQGVSTKTCQGRAPKGETCVGVVVAP